MSHGSKHGFKSNQSPVGRATPAGSTRFGGPSKKKQIYDLKSSLGEHTTLEVIINKRKFYIFVEKIIKNFVHAVTPEDIIQLLPYIEHEIEDDEATEFAIVLTQPQKNNTPSWGYFCTSDFDQFDGKAVFITATNLQPIEWGNHLKGGNNSGFSELERLQEDGHNIIREAKNITIYPTLEATRNTQLYRTLLHEFGHYVDQYNKIHKISKRDWKMEGYKDEFDYYTRLDDLYWSTQRDQHEEFAHNFAKKMSSMLKEKGVIPFDRLLAKSLKNYPNLRLPDFIPCFDTESVEK